MSGRQQVILMGKGPDGEPTVVSVDGDGKLRDVGTPARTPLHATITATGTRKNLSTADGGTAYSHVGWYLILQPGVVSVRIGTDTVTASTQIQVLVDATVQTRWPIRSATLDGWYVISEGADVDIELSGAVDT